VNRLEKSSRDATFLKWAWGSGLPLAFDEVLHGNYCLISKYISLLPRALPPGRCEPDLPWWSPDTVCIVGKPAARGAHWAVAADPDVWPVHEMVYGVWQVEQGVLAIAEPIGKPLHPHSHRLHEQIQ
jgi:hypothetical protein